VIEEFLFAFGDGISTESDNVTNERDAIVSDGEGKESGNVPLVTFVEPFKKQLARRLRLLKIVLNRLCATHRFSLKSEIKWGSITNTGSL